MPQVKTQRVRRWKAWLPLLLLWSVWIGSAAVGSVVAYRATNWGVSSDQGANEVKSALVFKFLRYVEWSPDRFKSEKEPIRVGVVGTGPMIKDLSKAFSNKRLGRRPFQLLIFKTPDDVRDCHILFVTQSVSKERMLRRIFSRLPSKGVLLIGESDGFVRAGGIMSFYLEHTKRGQKVRFEVNPDEAKRRGIKISASLLKLARIVRDPKKKKDDFVDSNSPGNLERESGREGGR